MAPRQTARRLLVAAPALAIAALAVTACSPPNQQPADPDASYTLPTYSEAPKASTSEKAPEHTAATGTEAPHEGAATPAAEPGQNQAPAAQPVPPAQPAP